MFARLITAIWHNQNHENDQSSFHLLRMTNGKGMSEPDYMVSPQSFVVWGSKLIPAILTRGRAMWYFFNSSSPSAAYVHWWTGSALVQVMVVTCSVPSHYLNQCCFIVNGTLGNNFSWKLNWNSNTFIQENATETVVHEMAAILSRGRWVQSSSPGQNGCHFTDDIFKCIFVNENFFIITNNIIIYPPNNEVVGGVYWFHSVRPSVRLSVRPSVRPSRMPCPLCIIYSYGWILFILGTNDQYHERVCRAPWPLTLTYIFKVIRPWLRKSCPLCSFYSSGWILSIFSTNDHYH